MDFQSLIDDLLDAGWTQDEIAAQVGTTQSTISTLLSDGLRQPRYNLGEALVELHKREVGQ